MEVRIRLQKSDNKASGRYNYRIVVIPRNMPRQGKALDILGYYDASKKPAAFSVDVAKVEQWVAKGARMSQTISDLVKKAKKKA